MKITDSDSAAVSNATLVVDLPSDFTVSNSGGGSETAGPPHTLTWSNLEVPEGEGLVLTFTATPICNANTGQQMTATVTGGDFDISDQIVVGNPVLTVELVDSDGDSVSEKQVGDTVTWTLTVENIGNADLGGSGATIDFILGNDFGSPSIATTSGHATPDDPFSNGLNTWTTGPITQTVPALYEITATVERCNRSNLVNDVDVSWACQTADTLHASVALEILEPNVEITMTTPPPEYISYCGGSDIKISIKNTGAGPAEGFKLKLPEDWPDSWSIDNDKISCGLADCEVTFETDSGEKYFSISDIDGGATLPFTFNVSPGSCDAATEAIVYFIPEYVNQCGPEDGTEYSTPVIDPQVWKMESRTAGVAPVFSITKELISGTPELGQDLTYKITVTYDGPDGSYVANIRDTYNLKYTFSSATNTDGFNHTAPNIDWTHTFTTSGDSVTYEVTLTAPTDPCDAFSSYDNKAEIVSVTPSNFEDCMACDEAIDLPEALIDTFFPDTNSPAIASSLSESILGNDVCTEIGFETEYTFGSGAPGNWTGVTLDTVITDDETGDPDSSNFGVPELDEITVGGNSYACANDFVADGDGYSLDLSCLPDTAPPSDGVILVIKYSYPNAAVSNQVEKAYTNTAALTLPGAGTGCDGTEHYDVNASFSIEGTDMTLTPGGDLFVNTCGAQDFTIEIGGGPHNIYDAVVTLNPEDHYEYVSGSATFNATIRDTAGAPVDTSLEEPVLNAADGTYTWTLGDIQPKGTITFQMRRLCGEGPNSADWSVSGKYNDNCHNNDDPATESVAPATYKPLLTKDGDPTLHLVPETILALTPDPEFTVYIVNGGAGDLFLTQLVLELGDHLEYVSPIPPIPPEPETIIVSSDKHTVTFKYNTDLGNRIAAGEQVAIPVTTTLTGCEEMDIKATLEWCDGDANCEQPLEKSSTVTLTGIEATVTEHSGGPLEYCGDAATFTIKTKNTGKVSIYDTQITELLPEGVVYDSMVSGSEPTITDEGTRKRLTWDFSGEMAVGTEYSVEFKVRIDTSDCTTSDIFLSQQAEAKAIFKRPCETTATVGQGASAPKLLLFQAANPEVKITKEAWNTTKYSSENFVSGEVDADPGDEIEWRITLTNIGDYVAKSVNLTDALPGNVIYDTATDSLDSTPITDDTWYTTGLDLGDMAIGVSLKVVYRTTVNEGGCTSDPTTNKATATYGCCSDAPMQETKDAIINLRTQPDFGTGSKIEIAHNNWTTCNGEVVIRITNNGGTAISEQIVDTLPTGYTYDDSFTATAVATNTPSGITDPAHIEFSAVPSVSGNVLTWDSTKIDKIYPGETITITFRVKRDGNGSGACAVPGTDNTVGFDYHTTCNTTTITDTKTEPVTPDEADVAVTLEVLQDVNTDPNSTGKWRLTLTNNGDIPAENITVKDTLGVGFGNQPTVTSGDSATSWSKNTDGEWVGTWEINSIEKGDENAWQVEFEAKKTADNSLTNVATVVGTCQNDNGNDETCRYLNETVSAYAGSSFDKTVDEPTANIGEKRTYTITADFANTGEDDDYSGVTITDTLPSGLVYVSAAQNGGDFSVAPTISGQNITWNLGAFTGPKSFSYDVTVRVENADTNQLDTELDNDAVVTYTLGSDTFTDNATAKITVTEPNLELAKTITSPASGSGAEAGDTTSWQIVLKNEAPGNGTAYQVDLKDVLPDGLNNISGVSLVKSGTGNAYINGTTTPVTTAHLHILTTTNPNDTLDLAIAGDGADTIRLEPDATLTITFDAVIMDTVSTGAVLKNEIKSPYKSTPSDNDDTRNDTDNPDDEDTTSLNNYGETASATMSLAAGKVGDTVWFDTDDDGVQDVGEPGLANVTVTLYDGAGNVVTTAVTDANGKYLFTNLPDGNYRVAVTDGVPTGLDPSANPTDIFTLPVNGSQLDRDFGYTNTSSTAVIGDLVWHDVNGDGVQNSGEPGLGNVNLSLMGPGTDGILGTADDNTVTTVTTAPDGSYLFTGVDQGDYLVKVTNAASVLSGYTSTTGGNTSSLVTVAEGDSYLNADFGYLNTSLHSISDTVWNDSDNDGSKDGGEPGISGVTVNLLNSSGVVIATTTTDSSGNFSFPGLSDSNYTVVIEDNADKLQGYHGTTTEGKNRQMPVTVSGADVTGVHFGYNRPGVIGDRVWSDSDEDGVQDADELGIGGVTLDLIDLGADGAVGGGDDSVIDTITTAADGSYLFTGVPDGKYVVDVTDTDDKLNGYVPTTGTTDPSALITLEVNGSYLDADFGYYKDLPDVSGSIWEDLNVNKTDDGTGEPPFTGVTVALLDGSGDIVAETTTDTDGGYTFENVPAGEYTVKVTDTGSVLDGYTLTTDTLGYSITVAATDITDRDFGYVRSPETGSIGDRVWQDTDGDTSQGTVDDEPGLAGVTVKLVTPGSDGLFGTTDDEIKDTQETGDNGTYLFENLPAGLYQVMVDETTVPAGYGLTTENNPLIVTLDTGEKHEEADFGYQPQGTVTGHLFVDTDGNGTQDDGEPDLPGVKIVITDSQGHSHIVTTDASGNYSAGVPAGSTIVDIDETTLPAGYVQTAGNDTDTVNVTVGTTADAGNDGFQPRATVEGHVFEDRNGNGIQDDGEPNWPGVDVVITDSQGETQRVTTGSDGNYSADIPAGNTIVDVDETTLPPNYFQTAGTDPTAVNAPSGSRTDAGDDGYKEQVATIGDTVWNDADGDGEQDADEYGIEGVTIALYSDENGDGLINGADAVIDTKTTDENGTYDFENLPAGDYIVDVTDTGNVLTDYNLTVGSKDPLGVTVTDGQDYNDADFGYRNSGGTASIGDYVWDDADGDGVQDAGEKGIAGVTIDLHSDHNGDGVISSADRVLATVTTDENGAYDFTNLPAGDYIVDVTDTDGVLTDYNLTVGSKDPLGVTVTDGQDYNDADFGYRDSGGTASIGDLVWDDVDGDGVRDAGESGLRGVTLDLYADTDGDGVISGADTVVATVTTDENGNYDFTDLPAGDYIVDVTDTDNLLKNHNLTGGTDPLAVTVTDGQDYNEADFGYQPVSTAGIGDFVWNDANGDGVQAPGEAGIEGVTIALYSDADGNGVIDDTDIVVEVLTTDADGRYQFSGLLSGSYIVDVTDERNVLTGYDLTTGNDPLPVNLAKEEVYADADFGYRPRLSSIGDYVWNDINGNGVQDANEPGIGGVTVRLLNSTGQVADETQTNGSGEYEFTDLLPGDYVIEFVKPADDYIFSPGNQGTGDLQDAFDSDADPLTGRTETISLGAGESYTKADAGMRLPDGELASVGDRIWYDTDGDGIQDDGEPGIDGVTVRLLSEAGDVIGETQTEDGGAYRFSGLLSGSYSIEVVPPDGYSVSPQDQGGDDAGDSDIDPATNRTALISLSAGEARSDADAGLGIPGTTPAAIGDYVWYDADGDGVQDADEDSLPGVTVTLYATDGVTPMSTATTDGEGAYGFTGLTPGDYVVGFGLPDGYTFSPAGQGGDSAADSDADVATGRVSVTVAAGETRTDIDAGLYAATTILLGDQVWEDADGDGSFSDGEGIPGVPVSLYDGDGDLIRTTETDENGRYLFENLPPGDYRVVVETPDGLTPFDDPDGLPDSKTDVTDQDSDNTDLDFGYRREPGETASLGDYVWYDTDGDGVQDADESGLPGVTVRLLDSTGQVADETQTDGLGKYEFTDLSPGDYRVAFVSPDDSYVFSAQDQGAGALQDVFDSDADPETGQTALISLSAGENNVRADAGLRIPGTGLATIGDRIWYDTNDDGVQDDGEPGIDGVTVRLLDGDGLLVAETRTNDFGTYIFSGLTPGDYVVEVVPPEGYSVSPQHQGTDGATDSDIDPATNRTDVISLGAGEVISDADAGLRIPDMLPASIGDRVWFDADGDGIQDAGEDGLSGVTVTFYAADGTTPLSVVTTDSLGGYEFTGLASGDYVIEFDLPDGYGFSPSGQGDDGATDSDTDADTGRVTVSLSAGEDRSDIDAGLSAARTITLGDTIWLDEDGDGLVSDGEGIANVLVNLYDGNGDLIRTTATNPDGQYHFSDLPTGDYRVEVDTDTLPDNVAPFFDIDGILDSRTDVEDQLSDNLNLDFGYRSVEPASLGDRVWYDTDRDGIQDEGETGVAGVTVRLYNENLALLDSAVTDGSGAYLFDNLTQGNYIIEFVPPSDAGYQFSAPEQGSGLLRDAFDSDPAPDTGRTGSVTLAEGENNTSVDAGLYIPSVAEPAGIGDRVWYDTDGDGVQDDGEPGVAGVTVRLIDADTGAEIASTRTDGSGNYLFDGLPPGEYIISVDLPDGYIVSPLNQGDDDMADSDVNPDTNQSGIIPLEAGSHIDDLDVGLLIPGTLPAGIGDRVWHDTDQNGIQDAGEIGISEVTVLLRDGDTGVLLASATTDDDGNYLFNGFPAGNYVVEFIPPSGYRFSPEDAGEDSADSDADPDSGQTPVISLAAGAENRDADAGMYRTEFLAIGDLVWLDADGNSLPSAGEGIGGVTLRLYDGFGNLRDTTTTDGSGFYEFTGLTPGDYRVVVDTATLPDNVEPLADLDGGLNSLTDLVGLSEDNPDVDFGYYLPESPVSPEPPDVLNRIGDFVWLDTDRDGVQDADEPGLSGITVGLYNATGTTLLAETVTDSQGRYYFTGLQAGDYMVALDLPDGYLISDPNQGGDSGADSNPDPVTGRTEVRVLPGISDLTIDAGVYGNLFIGELVWLDENGDGVPDAGEGIPGVRVVLYDGDGDVIADTVTDEDGNYRFENLPPGDYRVSVDSTTLPEGVTLFADPEGETDGTADLPGVTEDVPDADFGYRLPGDDETPDLTHAAKSGLDLNGGHLVPGDIVEYTVTLFNAGQGAAEGAVYTDTPHSHTTLVNGSVTTTQGTVATGNGSGDGVIRAEIGTISAGGTVTIRYRVELKADTPAGIWIENQGVVSGDNFEDEPTDWPNSLPPDDPTIDGPVYGEADDADVTVTKTATDLSGSDLKPGDTVEYTVLISNAGPDTAENLVFHDSVPHRTTLVSGSLSATQGTVAEGDPLRAVLGNLGTGDTATVTFRVTVDADVPAHTVILNQGVVNGDGGIHEITDDPGSVPEEDGTLVVVRGSGPNLDLFKAVWDHDGGPVNAGDALEYRITVVNTGDAVARNVVVTDEPSGYITLISGTVGNTGGQVVSGNGESDTGVEVTLGDLEPGAQAEITFQVTVSEDTPDETRISNQGTARSDDTPDVPSDDPLTAVTDDPTVVVVTAGPDLYDPPAAWKTVSGGRPVIRWAMRWINDGNTDAVLVHIEDPIPVGTVYVADSLGADYGTFRYDADLNAIVWEGDIPGNGGTLSIWYETRVPDDVARADNQACAVWDLNGNGMWQDEADSDLSRLCTDDPDTPESGDATVWSGPCDMSIGNRVWEDTDRDSYCAMSDENLMNGVTINLYRDTDGNNLFTPGTDEFLGTTVTLSHDGEDGYYRFDNLCEGDYIVQVGPANFEAGGVLYGYESSAGAPDPDNDADNDDNGYPLDGYGVVSYAVTLTRDGEPVNDGDGEARTNLTVDFGFFTETSPCPDCVPPLKPF
ncbi:hypothetical protein DENIS_2575 [Desulfonema ishimotonii]|uniref:DUF11 domain-containing protein n=1 Tax=Desulfonema ishimotonii TaxID=45657 RepID=A0A401FXG1_9BACT|nr:SdrD B-like domain-containing protein [Desulfonema ishimotonii]GBC61613.1 hypothetical protein DENIS_2575 [Desulfonema ishimotonii]